MTSLTFDGDSVDGRCFRNAPVTVQLFDALGELTSTEQTTSDGTGAWSVTTTLLAGTTIRAWCADPAGDVVLTELLAI